MKSYIDFLLENEILSEALMAMDKFEIGFELEGYIGHYNNPLKDYIKKRAEEENREIILNWLNGRGDFPAAQVYPYVTEYMMHDLLDGMNASELVKTSAFTTADASLKDEDSCCGFEFDSPVFPCTNKWLRKIISCLQKWIKEKSIYTDEECGFHNHISWKGMTEEDRDWTYCQIAVDFENILRNFEYLEYEIDGAFYDYTFSSHWYATKEFVYRMKDAIVKGDFVTIKNQLKTNKFSLFNLHPEYGTIEWRGPRDFMNSGDIEHIQLFYNMLGRLLHEISRLQNIKTIKCGRKTYTKETFFKKLNTI